jgi:hypothetical protein
VPLALLACIAIALYHFWPRNHLEIQPREAKGSPDGKWLAVVQLEVYDPAWVVNDAVYAVRLKEATQRDSKGELVMNVPVNYPEPEPSINWSNDKLVVTLAAHQKYQYFVTPVSGVAIVVQQKQHSTESGRRWMLPRPRSLRPSTDIQKQAVSLMVCT